MHETDILLLLKIARFFQCAFPRCCAKKEAVLAPMVRLSHILLLVYVAIINMVVHNLFILHSGYENS